MSSDDRPVSISNKKQLVGYLEWYLASGVDWVLEEYPVSRFTDVSVDKVSKDPVLSIVGGHALSSAAELSSGKDLGPIATSASVAGSANSLGELLEIMERFDGCALKHTAMNLVFGDGNPDSHLMLVGEAPGKDEDLRGLPFVGRSGKLLDKMLLSIGVTRASCYITNIVPWRPPGNRTPSSQEVAACLPFVVRHIELVKPKILLLLGGAATIALTGLKEGILKLRGNWMKLKIGELSVRAIATFHPAYLLRQPLQKRLAWQDLCAVREALSNNDFCM